MPTIIAVANQKGGVGKTTTAVNLVDGIQRKGFKALAVELDTQKNMSYALGIENEDTKCTFVDVLLGNNKFCDVVQHTARCDIWPADNSLVGWKAGRIDIEIDKLKQVLSKRCEYDYIVIDTAPDKSFVTTAALTAADKLVVVVQPDMFSVHALRDFYLFYKRIVSNVNKELVIDGILITRFVGRTNVSKKAKAVFEKAAIAFNTRIYANPIRETVLVKEALAEQKSLFEYARNSDVANEYLKFVEDVIGR